MRIGTKMGIDEDQDEDRDEDFLESVSVHLHCSFVSRASNVNTCSGDSRLFERASPSAGDGHKICVHHGVSDRHNDWEALCIY